MLIFPPFSLVQVLAVVLSSVAISMANLVRGKVRAAKLLASVPGPEGVFLLGFIPELTKNIHRIYDFQLSDPADVEHLLSKNVNNWVKSDRFIRAMGDTFGKSFIGINHAHTADNGAMWRLQRKIITRVFTTANFKAYTEGTFLKNLDYVFASLSWRGVKKPYEFPVFQAGPRICPGMNMALLETKLFVAILLEKFHVRIQEGEQVKDRGYVLGPSLVVAGGLPLQFTPRTTPGQ